MNDEMTIDKVEKDTTEFTKHIRSILEFVKTTESMTENGLKFDWKYYDNDDHGSVPLITEYDAIRFLFPWYTLKGINQFFDPTSTATAEDLQNLVDKHYKNASNEFGYETLPPESFINSLGYGFLNNKKLENAKAMFNMNVKNYPNSSNVYDSMGDCYLALKDSIKALEFFTKALDIGENDDSKEKIDMLKEQLNLE